MQYNMLLFYMQLIHELNIHQYNTGYTFIGNKRYVAMRGSLSIHTYILYIYILNFISVTKK